MIVLENDPRHEQYQGAMMDFLNKYGLDAAAILGMARRSEAVHYQAGETVLEQGQFNKYIYFLVEGDLRIRLEGDGEARILGERTPVTLLGEISYFNGTPATVTVDVTAAAPAVLMRLSYDRFGEMLAMHPAIRNTLVRIGELRMISQYDGFIRYHLFMNMIGWKRDRFAVNRALFPALESAVRGVLMPRVNPQDRILEVGDGPGIVSELLAEIKPDLLPHLFLQATYLEEAITNPFHPRASDLSRAAYLREKFHHIVALQVFNTVPPHRLAEQFDLARRMLHPGGRLLIVKLRLLNIDRATGGADSRMLYQDLEELMERVWPTVLKDRPLIQVTFTDADLDPLMEWNPGFCRKVDSGEIALPKGIKTAERAMLSVVLRQAKGQLFNPDEVHFHWLAWNAAHYDFTLEDSAQQPEIGYFHLLLKLS
jgi:hypothetical protein